MWNRARGPAVPATAEAVARSTGGGSTDDATAIARARAGDLDAYEVLVARYSAAAHRTAALLGAGDDAEDVVQEAFVKAYRALGRFKTEATFRPWLLQIVANETMNLHRSARRRSGLTLRLAQIGDSTPAGDDPAGEAVRDERRRLLLAAVRELPEKDQQVLTCRYFLELSEAETATVLGWPAGSVKSRLSRALVRLRTKLAQPLGEGVPGG